jgi:heptosyltransferase-2
MSRARRVLVVQTAFPGDVVLTLPLLQRLRFHWPEVHLATVTTPMASPLLAGHPAVSESFLYDKRGRERGVKSLIRLASRLRREHFDVALLPHRSLRSALLVALAGIPVRIGFDRSWGRLLLTKTVHYERSLHEIQRNLQLLRPLGLDPGGGEFPSLFPSRGDVAVVDRLLSAWRSRGGAVLPLVGLAPGSVWATKRWPIGSFAQLGQLFRGRGYALVLVGSSAERLLCEEVSDAVGDRYALNVAGETTFLQSAELLRRCALLVSNDSAPMHLAVAMRLPVVAVFGATVPAFGFYPLGKRDRVVERSGLACRPCSIHGGEKCPIRTFECMRSISPEEVFHVAEPMLVSTDPE